MLGVGLSPVWGQNGEVCLDGGCSQFFGRVRARVAVIHANVLRVSVVHPESSREGRWMEPSDICPECMYLIVVGCTLFAHDGFGLTPSGAPAYILQAT